MPKSGPPKETPVRAQLLQRLRSAITEGMFQPGDHLVERELCELLGVSRTSLREAMRQIEAEGLIEFFPNRGAIVCEITTEEVLDLWVLRSNVEALVARRFATYATDEDIARFEASIAAMDAALKKQDRAAIKHAKLELWESFAAGGHNNACAKLIHQINARLSFLWSSSLLLPGRSAESVAEFSTLVAAIKSRNPSLAEAAMLLHNEHAKLVGLRGLAAFEASRSASRKPARRGAGRARAASPVSAAASVETAASPAKTVKSTKPVRKTVRKKQAA